MAVQDTESKAPNAPHGTTTSTNPYNDWPNDAGVRQNLPIPFVPSGTNLFLKFETVHEETVPVELKVSGRIPAYAA